MGQGERLQNIEKIYDNLGHAEQYFHCEKSTGFRDKISHKQFVTVLSNLDFEFPKNRRVMALDIGCSSGRYTKGLTDRGIYAIGIDPAIIPLRYAAKRIHADFFRASAVSLPFKKAMFDLVICIELLHHFNDGVLGKVLKEISNVVKPGGFFIFDVKNKANPLVWYKYKREDNIEFTLKARTISYMSKLAKQHGFTMVTKKSLLFPISFFAPYVIVFSRRDE